MSRNVNSELCRALIQRLSELESERARVLRHLSHELKTPLAALREGISLLQDGVAGPLTTPQQEVVSILANNTRLLQQQIAELLDYHATVLDASRLQLRHVDLRGLVDSVVEAQRLQLQTQSQQVRVECSAGAVLLDPDKMRVALGNLLSNAIAFTPPGGEIVFHISRGASVGKPGSERLFIDCIDSGPGVAEADAAKIFDPFVQGRRRPASGAGGSGVGLSIVREVAMIHGGQVSLVTCAQGAHFRMELPYEE